MDSYADCVVALLDHLGVSTAVVGGVSLGANVALLEYDSKHIDMTDLDASRVLSMILDYCKANPDKRPGNALDAFIKTAKKSKAQWKTGTVEWDE